ncbi:acetyl-CoA acetyltransferase [Candidatus Binatia bacterium]|nr:acetyl-CoA acetyltransferase [Candidatus Binatia bacterium]
MKRDDRLPVLIGAGQITQRDVDPAVAFEPLGLMAESARLAAADTGAGPGVLAQLDTVAVVNTIGWHYNNAPGALAALLEARPTRQIYTHVGGNTPQLLVNELAAAIAAGSVGCALIAGAEAISTAVRARRAGVTLDWSRGVDGTPETIGSARLGSSDHEMTHGLQLPVQIYPLFENALRARTGLSLAAHRERIGALYSRFSEVAARNPGAWFPHARNPEEITKVTDENRMIAFPYTKRMNAIIEVDQGAALLLTSVGTARALGVPESKWVYLWGCGDATDLWYPTDRVDFCSSPAIRAAGRAALAMAGVGIDDIDHFDLYSCFPCAVQIGRDMLGVRDDDARALTVTGGLAYHGGPGNNYSTHAIATMMERVRNSPDTLGLVTALGWYLTKHAVGVYAATPPPHAATWRREDPARYQAEIDAMAHPPLQPEPQGRGTIETYTVVYARDGAPEKGIVVGRLSDGSRFVANTPSDRAVLESLTEREGVGRAGTVTSGGGLNRFDPD